MLAFPMRKGDNILLYKTELEADKITKNCIDSDSSKLKIFKNGNELFHLGTYQDVINNSIDIRRCLKEAYKDNNAKIIINSKENLGEYDKYEFSNINPNTIDEIWSYYINFFQHLKNGKEIKKSTFSESNNILRLNRLKKYLESKLVLELLDQSIDKYSKIEIIKSTKYEFVSHNEKVIYNRFAL